MSSFLLKKWRNSFKFLDLTKDGLLTGEDYRAIADFISTKTGASEEEFAKMREEWLKWHRLLQPEPSVTPDLEHYIQGCVDLYKDSANYRNMLTAWAGTLFDMMDLDGNGTISSEELKTFYEAVGIRDEMTISRIFQDIDKNKDNKIQREEFVSDMIDYFMGDDPDDHSFHFIPDMSLTVS